MESTVAMWLIVHLNVEEKGGVTVTTLSHPPRSRRRANHSAKGRCCSIRGWQSRPRIPVSSSSFSEVFTEPDGIFLQRLLEHRPHFLVISAVVAHPLAQQRRRLPVPPHALGRRQRIDPWLRPCRPPPRCRLRLAHGPSPT